MSAIGIAVLACAASAAAGAALFEAAVRSVQPYADAFVVTYEPRAAAPGARVSADPDRLMQVLTNLLSNAAEFSPEKGAVAVAIDRTPARWTRGARERGWG